MSIADLTVLKRYPAEIKQRLSVVVGLGASRNSTHALDLRSSP